MSTIDLLGFGQHSHDDWTKTWRGILLDRRKTTLRRMGWYWASDFKKNLNPPTYKASCIRHLVRSSLPLGVKSKSKSVIYGLFKLLFDRQHWLLFTCYVWMFRPHILVTGTLICQLLERLFVWFQKFFLFASSSSQAKSDNKQKIDVCKWKVKKTTQIKI